jgi:centrosomal protein CEP41
MPSTTMRMSNNGIAGPPKRGYETRVPENARYADVRAKVSSGTTQAKVKYLTNRQVLMRRDETFRRISRDDLAELFEEYEKIDDERLDTLGAGADPGNGPRVCVYEEDAAVTYERPYLVLDVRSPEEFGDCHVLQARSLPQRLLMQDKVQGDMYRFRNKEGMLIVLYDNDERLAAAAAHQLAHRGFDNVYVLSRGLTAFAAAFPHYVEGDTSTLPQPEPSPRKSGRGRGGSSSSSSSSSARAGSNRSTPSTVRALSHRSGSVASHASSRFNQRSNRRDDDDKLSRMSELSVADSVISRATNRKNRY